MVYVILYVIMIVYRRRKRVCVYMLSVLLLLSIVLPAANMGGGLVDSRGIVGGAYCI